MSQESLINKMLLGFICSVTAGVIAWVTLVGFVTRLVSAHGEQKGVL